MHDVYLQVVSYSLVLGMERITLFRNQGIMMEDCTGIMLPLDDFHSQNISLFLLQCLPDVYQRDLIVEPGKIVCVENVKNMKNIVNDWSADGFDYLSIALSMTSLLCLIIRLCLQKYNASFQTKSGKMQFHLALSLALSNVLLLTSPLANSLKPLCSVLGGLKYLFFLSTFVWITCISISLWHTIRPSNLTTVVDNSSLTIRDTILTWLLPSILSAVIYISDYLSIQYIISPGFGGKACWFTNSLALLILFIIPISVFVGVNNNSLYISGSLPAVNIQCQQHLEYIHNTKQLQRVPETFPSHGGSLVVAVLGSDYRW